MLAKDMTPDYGTRGYHCRHVVGQRLVLSSWKGSFDQLARCSVLVLGPPQCQIVVSYEANPCIKTVL